jgi:hypothetical protein
MQRDCPALAPCPWEQCGNLVPFKAAANGYQSPGSPTRPFARSTHHFRARSQIELAAANTIVQNAGVGCMTSKRVDAGDSSLKGLRYMRSDEFAAVRRHLWQSHISLALRPPSSATPLAAPISATAEGACPPAIWPECAFPAPRQQCCGRPAHGHELLKVMHKAWRSRQWCRTGSRLDATHSCDNAVERGSIFRRNEPIQTSCPARRAGRSLCLPGLGRCELCHR